MKRIAFLLDYLYSATYQDMVVNGLISALPGRDIELYIMIGGSYKIDPYDRYVSNRNKLYELITREKFDGIVVSTTLQNNISQEETIEFLDRYKGIPIIFFGPGPDKYPQVLVDNKYGMHDLVTHFVVDHGYRRIAFVTGPHGQKDSEERLQEYKQVLKDRGIPFDPGLVCNGDFNFHKGIEAVRTLVDERKIDFDAVIAANDLLALGVKVELEQKGYAIPSDVAIAGFDDSVDATSIIPSLTTVGSPYALLGRKVFDIMLAAINGKEVPKMSAIPTELVIRQSCGCDPGKKNKIIFNYSEIDGAGPVAYISGHRKELMESISNLLAPLNVDAGNLGIDTLLDILQNEIIRETEVETYFTIQRLIMSSLSNKMSVELWQDVISEIRHFISPLLKMRDQIESAENFFHKARLVVSDIQTIQKKQNLLHSLKQSIQMGVVSETLVNSIETKKLRNAIYQTFPLFDIRNFLFAELIETPEGTMHAKLIAMLTNRKGWNSDDEILFSPTGFYPEKVKDFDSRVLFLLPVVYEENYMGYVIYGKIKNILPFYSTDTQRLGWDIFSEKSNEPQSLTQSLYHTLTRDVAKSFYICRLIKLRKEVEESLKILTMNLKFRNRELQDFAHIASHDLQEPLRKITFFSERLNKMISNKITPDEVDYLSRINHAVTRMNELIAGLLAYSRITTKQQPFTRVNLKIIIMEVLQDIEVRIRETKGRVEVDDLPFIKADPLQMRQLFQNLIGNALKYHRKDVPPVVTVTSEMDGTYCIILLSDNGIGFDQKHAEKIFGIFQRFVGKNEYEGTGVGLAICKKIIEQHGGTISAFGEPGKGSRFVIRMPVAD